MISTVVNPKEREQAYVGASETQMPNWGTQRSWRSASGHFDIVLEEK